MYLKFFGVRGSIAVPGGETLRYGGNTTCLEIRGDHGEVVILDAGTGIVKLGHKLMTEQVANINIFISHTHWDHIQGLPFFTPLFVPKNNISVFGPIDSVSGVGIKERLSTQMDRHYFPVQQDDLQSNLVFNDLSEGQKIIVGSLTITCFLFNHPVTNFGYRIDDGCKSIVFTGDHEWPVQPHPAQDKTNGEAQAVIEKRRRETIDFMTDADILVIDTAYTEEEYQTRHGWGHGTFDSSILAGREAKAKEVYLTHHEPGRTDSNLESIYVAALQRNNVTEADPKFMLAKEGMEIHP